MARALEIGTGIHVMNGIANENAQSRTMNSVVTAGMGTGIHVGAVAKVVGIEGGVVSGVMNLESPGVGAPGRRPRHDVTSPRTSIFSTVGSIRLSMRCAIGCALSSRS